MALTPTTSKAQDTLVPGRAEVAAVIDAALDIEHCTLLELLPAVTYTRQSGSSSGQLEMTKDPGAATPSGPFRVADGCAPADPDGSLR